MVDTDLNHGGGESFGRPGLFRWQELVLVVLLAVFMAARRVELLQYPRLWAEEGKYYFAHAFTNGFTSALFAPHFGYFSLVPNLSTALATLVPLEFAPLITTSIAFVLQVTTCSIPICGTSKYWDTVSKKIIVAFSIPLLAPGEVWLTTICTQYWFTIGVFLILLEDTARLTTARKWFYRCFVAIAGLTSVGSCLMTPLFLWKVLKDKVREDRVQTAILTASFAIQSVVFLVSYAQGDSHLGTRFGENHFSLLKVLHLHFTVPLLGKSLFESLPVVQLDYAIASRIFSTFGDIVYELPRTSFLIADVVAASLFGYLLMRNVLDRKNRMVGLSFLFISCMSTLLSLRMASSPRYAFAPSVMLVILLLAELFRRDVKRLQRVLAGGLLCSLMLVNLYEYRWSMGLFYSDNWPRWRDEVQQWRLNPAAPLQIWPQWSNGRWSVALTGPEKQ